jgi:type IV secretory pathway component VirB8
LNSAAWDSYPIHSSSYTPDDTTAICSYKLQRKIAYNTHITDKTDKSTYNMVFMQAYPFSSLKFVFLNVCYNFLGYKIIIPTKIITVIIIIIRKINKPIRKVSFKSKGLTEKVHPRNQHSTVTRFHPCN